MRPFIPVGVIAGIVSAILTVLPVAGGAVLLLPLALAAPLPIAFAGFAFGSAASAIGAVALGAAVGLAADFGSGAIALLTVGAPIAAIVHFFGLSRPGGPDGATEWYPLGPILLRVAAIVAAGAIVAGIAAGFDAETFAAGLRTDFAALFAEAGIATNEIELARFAETLAAAAPVAVAAASVAIAVANAFLGAAIAIGRGYPVRPRPAAWTVGLPRTASMVFVFAAVGSLIDGPVGDAATAVAGAFGAALVLVGLGVIHALTLRVGARPFILVLVYVSMPLFVWIPALFYAALGLLDTLSPLRPPPSAAGPSPRT
jgi:hypothetical protein